MLLYDYLAAAFEAEGVDTVFGLMGDGNMFWMSAMAGRVGAEIVHARHENAAVAMADGYARANGRVGVATVTCGPGVTQILTSLTASVRARTPLVVFAGQTPVGAAFHLQELDQRPVVCSTGAEFVGVATMDQALDAVARAFHLARTLRIPVVLSVPYDLQETDQPWTEVVVSSDALVPQAPPNAPSPQAIADVAALLRTAETPVIVAGAGAVRSGCRDEILRLADLTDAHVATTLRAKDWFEGEPRDLGIAGAFAGEAAREIFAEADVVLGLGARLGSYTTEAGYLFPLAHVVQVDLAPAGYLDGQRVADSYVRADAKAAVEALTALLPGRPVTGRRGQGRPLLERPARPAHRAGDPLDPSDAVQAIDQAVPADASITVGAGHFWNFVVPGLTGRSPLNYHFTYDFGVIGQAVPTAVGVATAHRRAGITTPSVVIEGDGSLLMNVQELETIARHGLPLLIIVMNDGAYGAEYHKLVAKGGDGDHAVFGRTDLAATARSFGLHGLSPGSPGELGTAIAEFLADPRGTVLDVPLDHHAVSDQYRRLYYGAAEISFGGDR